MPATRKPALGALIALLGGLAAHGAEGTNTVLLAVSEATNAVLYGGSPSAGVLPAPAPAFDAGASFVRVFGALLLVLGLFFGAVWFYRNWQRVARRGPGGTRLNVVEARSLGNKQSIVVVGYGSQRMLIGTAPSGVSLLAHLPAEDAEDVAPAPTGQSAPPSFMEALRQVVARKGS
jgi:flagellar biosynthetic protein FliO